MFGPGAYRPDPSEGMTATADLPQPDLVPYSRNDKRNACPRCGYVAYRDKQSQRTLHEQMPMGVQVDALLGESFFLAGCSLRCRGARTPFGQFGLLGPETLARAGHSTQHRFDHLGEDMKHTDLMRHPTKELRQGFGIQG